jgi:hypothetical protein
VQHENNLCAANTLAPSTASPYSKAASNHVAILREPSQASIVSLTRLSLRAPPDYIRLGASEQPNSSAVSFSETTSLLVVINLNPAMACNDQDAASGIAAWHDAQGGQLLLQNHQLLNSCRIMVKTTVLPTTIRLPPNVDTLMKKKDGRPDQAKEGDSESRIHRIRHTKKATTVGLST